CDRATHPAFLSIASLKLGIDVGECVSNCPKRRPSPSVTDTRQFIRSSCSRKIKKIRISCQVGNTAPRDGQVFPAMDDFKALIQQGFQERVIVADEEPV